MAIDFGHFLASQEVQDELSGRNELYETLGGVNEIQKGPVPTTGAEICTEAFDLITGSRATAYGHPLDDYEHVTAIFYALTGIRMSAEQGQLFMKSVKLARLIKNMKLGEFHRDSAVDDIGYMGTLGKTAQRRAERGEKMQWVEHDD